jgi:hypothetical protein
VLDCGCGNESVRKTNSGLSPDPTRAFRYRAIDRELPEWSKNRARQIRGGVACEQLRSGDDRIVQSVTARRQLASTSEVVDEDVRVDEDVSHDPIRLDWEQQHLVLLRR